MSGFPVLVCDVLFKLCTKRQMVNTAVAIESKLGNSRTRSCVYF